MLRVRERADQVRIAGSAAAVLGWTGAGTAGAPDGLVVAALRDVLDGYLVLPVVTEVVAVEERRARARDRPERRGVLVDAENLVGFDVRHAEADVADVKVVQMGVRPPEGDLKNVVQDAERSVGRHADAPPDGRLEVAELDAELDDITKFGQALSHTREDSREPGLRLARPAARARVRSDRAMSEIPAEYAGWWRIVETSQWPDDELDICGPALLSLTGQGDRLRMCCLLAYVHCKPTKTGVSFTWEGAWEFDQVSGTGSVKVGKDGRLKGNLRIKNGDDSTFIAERATEPDDPIPKPPSYRDKWRGR